MAGWIRVEADVHRHPKVVALPSPGARWAFIVTLAEGKAVEGRWVNVAHFRACVPAGEARYLGELIKAGLVRMEGPAVVIHDWSDYQITKGDHTAAERQRRRRERLGHGVSHGPSNVTSDRDTQRDVPVTSRAVSMSPSMSRRDNEEEDGLYQVSVPPEAPRLQALAEELTQRPNVLSNVWGGLGESAILQARKHGHAAVEREWRRIAAAEGGLPTLRQLVLGADDALNRIPKAIPESAADREARETAELRADAARRMAAQGARP